MIWYTPSLSSRQPLIVALLEMRESEPPSETTLLLREAFRPSLSKYTPIPILQLLVLACIRLADPLGSTIISPFKNEVSSRYPTQWNSNLAVDDDLPESNRQAIRDRVLLWFDGTPMSY